MERRFQAYRLYIIVTSKGIWIMVAVPDYGFVELNRRMDVNTYQVQMPSIIDEF